jgi:hypothetical protein
MRSCDSWDAYFEAWRHRDLAAEDILYFFMDGWYPKVRIGGRRERVPALVTLGVRSNGERVVLDLRLVGEESAASWTDVIASLTVRYLARPVLAIIDGNAGLMNALQSHWPAPRPRRAAGTRSLCRARSRMLARWRGAEAQRISGEERSCPYGKLQDRSATDERSAWPESVFRIAGIDVHHARNRRSR